mmetsp:Transcript_47222/g.68984  ORF Transcript_47222/g.68984 Transcript_47222/m.68984 type:complete len:91 (-) Transcript_47222:19-291(-)
MFFLYHSYQIHFYNNYHHDLFQFKAAAAVGEPTATIISHSACLLVMRMGRLLVIFFGPRQQQTTFYRRYHFSLRSIMLINDENGKSARHL